MIPSLRRWFNENYTPAKHGEFLELLEARCGEPPLFRHNETPVFLPDSLVAKMAQYGREMVEHLIADPVYERDSKAAIPERWRAPHEAERPLFVQADFGIDQDLDPKLVEIQGFPTLYAYQPVMAECYREAYGIDPSLRYLLADGYYDLLQRAILGDHDAREVVLLEVDPARQKTRHDFVMTEKLFGVRTVDIRDVRKEGRRLVHDGVPIRRIYNRAIVDELERKHVELAFDFRDDLDVEWAGHPNWFFRLSKFSLPYLKHPAVPWTEFLDRAGDIGDPSRYVLKPLYSFAGAGVVVGPTPEQLAAVPADRRRDYILQERVDFRPVIETPRGPTKVEIRIMYIWLDELRPVNTIIRTGRGAQMGVDHNKNLEWVGASAAFISK